MELIFTQPTRDRSANIESFSVSVVLHILAATAAVYLTINPPKKVVPKENILIPVVMEQDEKLKELPPPPPPPEGQKPLTMEDIPKGFQTLTVPTVIPPDIPPPTAGPATDEADFSGEGREGGLARGKADPNSTRTVTAEDLISAPTFTPYTVKPMLLNAEEVRAVLVKLYPPMLRDAGLGGTVLVWVFVDDHGVVRRSVVKNTSGLEALDSASLKVTSRMRFSPAQNRDVKVPVWVQIPIAFSVQ